MSEGTEGERHWLWGVLLRITIAFAVLALVTHTLVRPFVIPSGSMEPTHDRRPRLRPGRRCRRRRPRAR
ncbi:hypothetical protein [Janibacter indicus]|uniref:hypothetical protein n=1 Tax=Janibacter indicus TaxID=857417 RepID=UPI003D9A2EDC